MAKDTKLYISYNRVHQLVKESVERYRINDDFKPDLMIAIGGGGFIPARILRTFLKRANNKNIPIQAIGLSLYEDLGSYNLSTDDSQAIIGTQVIKTQWLHFGPSHATTSPLLGKNILIVDEVDDTRTTLAYAVQELSKDIEEEKRKFLQKNPGCIAPETKFAVFVLHNKKKEKRMEFPDPSIIEEGRYYAARETPDRWLVYPWEANDIEEHTKKSLIQEQEELQ
ncbi:PRTase-like protein [Rhizophagus irregularis]|uniref:Phosphoribosyltransferase-like protein n=3 Tax=Rhizophagus irregularis TaxID=588596 RepID=U9UGT8_RHIID|nr:phosphoribosyltransferase-like protein [Rhizophagus irregularis DAOM 181602=DAOM 197198]EXX60802.1 xanthine phosphoribosyltransferase [Rhizophagus irregularis DAOM 197198w]PKC08747.1 PRTase-like protein [Rhizophagus irregularis]PKK68319.1 PRTase-like protein [Rhizophagus irregularis]PKY24367.1 PRTase-like protein [Rhizophagus irregularis]PKY50747.1 PRTase-like protein [Rhizophagus irregularis]|eukprot:XP_025167916.1 phosphoribosyltransferase-like protein [Rhizophagus irregularis DAOM 181602=DAOM 197198]